MNKRLQYCSCLFFLVQLKPAPLCFSLPQYQTPILYTYDCIQSVITMLPHSIGHLFWSSISRTRAPLHFTIPYRLWMSVENSMENTQRGVGKFTGNLNSGGGSHATCGVHRLKRCVCGYHHQFLVE
ncbi:hypothetical protein K438DRAFT_997871 [Mycena galopus ATCC 62051]|nr:hypothetical protein K438DRAFT_997871 [Mycena galopus ATCC 62051]